MSPASGPRATISLAAEMAACEAICNELGVPAAMLACYLALRDIFQYLTGAMPFSTFIANAAERIEGGVPDDAATLGQWERSMRERLQPFRARHRILFEHRHDADRFRDFIARELDLNRKRADRFIRVVDAHLGPKPADVH